MKLLSRTTKWLICACAAAVLLQGCASTPVTIAKMPPAKYEILGHASGTAWGSLGIVDTGFYFIPMGVNSRIARAYGRALASVPGATGLINVELSEDWFWWVIGTARSTTISGDAIKEAGR